MGGLPPWVSKLWGVKLFWDPPFFSAPLRDIDTIFFEHVDQHGPYQISLNQVAGKYTFRYNRPPNFEKEHVFTEKNHIRFFLNFVSWCSLICSFK